MSWYDARDLGIEGRGWADVEHWCDRLPRRAEKVVRPPVWELSRNSTGMAVRFVTTATTVLARWRVKHRHADFTRYPASAHSGLDLYTRAKGASGGGGWVWAALGDPEGFPSHDRALAADMTSGRREFLLYLPGHNVIESLHLGVASDAEMSRAPARRGWRAKGVVFYGTSIVQGGCASRAGMGYPEIIARDLDCQSFNLGFSANALMEPELAALLSELDPAAFVIDSGPNMRAPLIRERAVPFLRTLRRARPRAPIVLVENPPYAYASVGVPWSKVPGENNAAFREAYAALKKAGVKGITYVRGEKLLGDDNLGTVDGVHPNDLGMFRMSRVIGAAVRKAVTR